MARIKTTILIDDLDGESEAQETVLFSFEGADYEIHLTTEHAVQFRATLDEWITHATRVKRKVNGTRSRGTANGDSHKIREWARSQNLPVPERGRIRDEIKRAYEAAHTQIPTE